MGINCAWGQMKSATVYTWMQHGDNGNKGERTCCFGKMIKEDLVIGPILYASIPIWKEGVDIRS